MRLEMDRTVVDQTSQTYEVANFGRWWI